MTKHLHDDFKCHLSVDDSKIEVMPKTIDNSLVIGTSRIPHPNSKLRVRMVKAKVTTKKSRLEKATSQLFDLECGNEPEQTLNIDLGLYQMEDY